MSKPYPFIRILVFVCCYFMQQYSYAQSSGVAFDVVDARAKADDRIVLSNPQDTLLISDKFAVYKQESNELSFEQFISSKNFLPYRKFNNPNYGFIKHGVWLYGTVQNNTELESWVLNIRFAQLQVADVYVRSNGRLIYRGSDGVLNKQSPFALPTFDIPLPQNQQLEIFVYLRSSSMSLLAPIYLQSHVVHESTAMVDFSIWGVFYGVIIVLGIYTLTFIGYKPSLVSAVFLVHLIVVAGFEILWSGQNSLSTAWLANIYEHLRAESFVLLMSITSMAFSLLLIPAHLHVRVLCRVMLGSLIISCGFFLLFFFSFVPLEFKLVVTYVLGFSNIALNITLTLQSYLKGFFPSRPLLIGWSLLLAGAVINTAFIFGFLPPHPYFPHLFQFSLVAQCVVFLLALAFKNQYDLQMEIKEAQTDAENNFSLIEEQNVHLDIARKEAIKASEVKSQFLANMSHEVRTPLNAIIGFSKELESKQNLVEREEHVRIINTAANDLLTIVNDILDHSKMEAGKLVINVRPFSLRDVLEDLVALMSKTAHLKQLEFIFEVGKLPTSLLGDAFKLKQLLSNLISNALKFTNYGYVTLKAEVIESDSKECMIEFQIKDTGIGISEDDKSKLFTAFHQLDDELNRSFQGTGLGLVICQELARLMRGDISIKSEPNRGSVFTVRIPFSIDRSAHSLKKEQPFSNQHAILIDEWPESQRTTAMQLANAGFNVDLFASTKEVENLNLSNDYVFVSLPFRTNETRNLQIEELSKLSTDNLVLLYSGPSPNSYQFSKLRKLPFLIRLPLTTQKLDDIQNSTAQAEPSAMTKKLNMLPPIRMLAVDDIDLNLRLLETWMANSPVTLDLAYDGKTAIKYCEKQEYDLILMDIQMPNMDGIETTSYIRKTELNMGTPVIAITAHALAGEKQRFLDSGMDDFLPKPIKIESLVGMIKSWCKQYPEAKAPSPESIDWELALERNYGNKDATLSFLDTFVERLPEHAKEIELGWAQQRIDIVLSSVHKLHGACCYTGVPRLQDYCDRAETGLKNDTLASNSKIVSKLLLEIEQVCAKWPKRREMLS